MGNVHGDGQPRKPGLQQAPSSLPPAGSGDDDGPGGFNFGNEGLDGRRVINQDGWELSLWNDMPDDEPRIRDVDLAERLGFKRPRKIRDLIERTFASGMRPNMRPTVGRIPVGPGRKGVREDVVHEYWLTEEEALEVTVASQTPKAKEIRRLIIRTFVAVRRGLIETTPTKSQVLALLLAPEFLPAPENARFKEALYRQIYRLKGKPYPTGVYGAPQAKWLANILVELFYLRLTGDSSLIDELRRRNPANAKGERRHRHHTGLRPEVADGPLRALVDTAIAVMRGHADGDWNGFIVLWDRSYPLRGRTAWLPTSIAPQLPPTRVPSSRPRPCGATGRGVA